MRFTVGFFALVLAAASASLAVSQESGEPADRAPQATPQQILQRLVPVAVRRGAEARPIAVFITAGVWCDPCTWFETFVLADPDIRSMMDEQFFTVRLLESDAESRAFPFQRVPTLLVYSPDGSSLLETLDGAVNVQTVRPILRRALERVAATEEEAAVARDIRRATAHQEDAAQASGGDGSEQTTVDGGRPGAGGTTDTGGLDHSDQSGAQDAGDQADDAGQTTQSSQGPVSVSPTSGSDQQADQEIVPEPFATLRLGAGRIQQTGEKTWRAYDVGLAPQLEEFDRDGEYRYLRNREAGMVVAVPPQGGTVWIWDGDARRWKEHGTATPVE